MTTHTLEVTDVPEDLLQLLDQRARQHAKDRSAYIRDLLWQDLSISAASAESLADVLAPFHAAVQAAGVTEGEAVDVFEETLRQTRAERRQISSSETRKAL